MLGLSMFPPLLAALAMAKEGELKTILQVYVSSIPAHEFLLGKIIAFMVVALAECLIMSLLLFTYFGLSFAGDPTPALIATVLYAFCVAAFGTMVGAVIPNQAAALQAVAFGGFLLVYLFSGLIFPVQNIPPGSVGFRISSGAGTTSRSFATRSCRVGDGPPCGTRSSSSARLEPSSTAWHGSA